MSGKAKQDAVLPTRTAEQEVTLRVTESEGHTRVCGLLVHMAKAFPAPKLERIGRSSATLCKSLKVKKVKNVMDCNESSERSALHKRKCRTMHIRCTEVPNPENRQSPWRFARALSEKRIV